MIVYFTVLIVLLAWWLKNHSELKPNRTTNEPDFAMKWFLYFFFTFFVFYFYNGFITTNDQEKPHEKDIVKRPAELDDHIKDNLKTVLIYASYNDGRITDTTQIKLYTLVNSIYNKNDFLPVWSKKGRWLPSCDTLFSFIDQSKMYGLFPSDYHFNALSNIRKSIAEDSVERKNAVLWTRADILLTDAFLLISKHLKQGRLPFDTLTSRKDTIFSDSMYVDALERFRTYNDIGVFKGMEPVHTGYKDIKKGLRSFLDSAEFRRFTYLPFPYKDSSQFYNLLQRRLFELDIFPSPSAFLDAEAWRDAINQYQEANNLKVTGRINESTISSLNNTDWEKFKLIALTLDKYKLFPDTMPATYLWVNIPAYYMKVIDSDSVALQSKVIVGTPKTQTPELNSEISNFITYPQWTVPYSIIFKEMLPQIQKNIDYLKKQNLMVVDKQDSVIDPATIEWSKLSKKKFPYLIKQRQGDDNSLGILKFNFRNPYSVYLHDTNARWLFNRTNRSMSHGCVRVQKWRDLAHFLIRNDAARFPVDTLASWITRQEKHIISGFAKLPIYIRYFTCEGNEGKITFYDDIYAEDKMLKEKYFFDKSIN